MNRIIAKGKRRASILRCLAGKDWGQSLETQKALYSTYIRSALEYASQSWFPWICQTTKDRLEAVQNECLRVMTRMAKRSPTDFMRLETGIEPLHVRLEKNDEVMWERYKRFEEEDPRRKLAEKRVKKRLDTRLGWRYKTEPKMDKNLNRRTGKTRLRPMMEYKAEVTGVRLDRKKEEFTIEELALRAEEKIAEINADVELYTDGSTSGKQKRGGAGLFIQNSRGEKLYEEAKPAGEFCSSYDGECVAMMRALEWIGNEPQEEGRKYAIFTDSKSMIMALETKSWKESHEWMKRVKKKLSEIRKEVTICWIPSHCNVYGNEKADKLAEKGSTLGQRNAPVTYGIAKAKIRSRKWEVTHGRAKQTFGERRKPKEMEQKWPAKIRRVFTRLRCGHAKELRSYRKRIDMETEDECTYCEDGVPETIEHVVCKCPQMEARRRSISAEKFKIQMMTTEPEKCRRMLQTGFPVLKWEEEKTR